MLRFEPEKQLSLAEQVKAENLSVKETRQRVREPLGFFNNGLDNFFLDALQICLR
ncbi:MAG: hypothetical protein OEZ25_05460 [Candidatus Bathyarchaeota archaeon]|nr:hypothetical protein [Candidatus Bathyarchaeota archaeon]